ncbi:unnamed protein product [Vitrella brassicaformis CCMP3155]|uniref:Spindle pole body component n=3 Tax=Vitrella brassicaformis TaxID=1169539 RepID=A0A0G4FN84_VITBC|nr:unnamed protein product [Vitrella brassicaformis CCMP3155]|eukprot:CEM15037.1 unnamed protein product [Vitrella brassicaformis CCMP3155]
MAGHIPVDRAREAAQDSTRLRPSSTTLPDRQPRLNGVTHNKPADEPPIPTLNGDDTHQPSYRRPLPSMPNTIAGPSGPSPAGIGNWDVERGGRGRWEGRSAADGWTGHVGGVEGRGREKDASRGKEQVFHEHLFYRTKIGIRSCSEPQPYLAATPDAGSLSGQTDSSSRPPSYCVDLSGTHPSPRLFDPPGESPTPPSEFVILNFDDRKYAKTVRFLDTVALQRQPSPGTCECAGLLSVTAQSTVTIETLKSHDATGSELCRWTVVNPDDPADDRSDVRLNQPVLLRSKFGQYLTTMATPALTELPLPTEVPRGSTKSQTTCVRADGTSGTSRAQWRLLKADVPPAPEWLMKRPALVHSARGEEERRQRAALESNARTPANVQLSQLSLEEQEAVLLEDILFVLMGRQGTYIQASDRRISPYDLPIYDFRIDTNLKGDPAADPSLVRMVENVTNLCTFHRSVCAFVETHWRHDYGLVSQALCAAMQTLLGEYQVFVSQLETELRRGTLRISKLWFLMQPARETMQMLHCVAKRNYRRKGGDLLSGIRSVTFETSSAPNSRKLGEFLLTRASEPLFDMLTKWLYHGCLDDPYDEFFIMSDPSLMPIDTEGGTGDRYWERKFVLDDTRVPVFLEETKKKILETGKYLNVLLSCQGGSEAAALKSRETPKIKYTNQFATYTELVEAAYEWASMSLVEFCWRQLDLKGRLLSVKHFFLLDKADFFYQFLEAANDELEKSVSCVALSKLESLLDLAIRTSSTANDPYRDSITCTLRPYMYLNACNYLASSDKGKHPTALQPSVADPPVAPPPAPAPVPPAAAPKPLPAFLFSDTVPATSSTAIPDPKQQAPSYGFHAFSIRYTAEWPLNLLFTRVSMLKYELIFRHLLFCKFVERKLCDVWQDHQHTKELNLHNALLNSYFTRQRMLHFCRNYVYYFTVEVLEPQWHQFMSELQTVRSFDEVLERHERFLDNCLKESLLTEASVLVKSLSKILTSCSLFAQNLWRFSTKFRGSDTGPKGSLAGEDGVLGGNSWERRTARMQLRGENLSKMMSEKKYFRMVQKFEKTFDKHLRDFLQHLVTHSRSKYEHHLVNLLTRIDFNSFYSSYFNMHISAPMGLLAISTHGGAGDAMVNAGPLWGRHHMPPAKLTAIDEGIEREGGTHNGAPLEQQEGDDD